jgi:hypothetical protein
MKRCAKRFGVRQSSAALEASLEVAGANLRRLLSQGRAPADREQSVDRARHTSKAAEDCRTPKRCAPRSQRAPCSWLRQRRLAAMCLRLNHSSFRLTNAAENDGCSSAWPQPQPTPDQDAAPRKHQPNAPLSVTRVQNLQNPPLPLAIALQFTQAGVCKICKKAMLINRPGSTNRHDSLDRLLSGSPLRSPSSLLTPAFTL